MFIREKKEKYVGWSERYGHRMAVQSTAYCLFRLKGRFCISNRMLLNGWKPTFVYK